LWEGIVSIRKNHFLYFFSPSLLWVWSTIYANLDASLNSFNKGFFEREISTASYFTWKNTYRHKLPPYNFSRKRRWNKEHTHWKKMEWSRWNERVLSSLPLQRRAERLRMFMTPHFSCCHVCAGRTSPVRSSVIRNERGRFPGKSSSKVHFSFGVPEVLLVDSRIKSEFHRIFFFFFFFLHDDDETADISFSRRIFLKNEKFSSPLFSLHNHIP